MYFFGGNPITTILSIIFFSILAADAFSKHSFFKVAKTSLIIFFILTLAASIFSVSVNISMVNHSYYNEEQRIFLYWIFDLLDFIIFPLLNVGGLYAFYKKCIVPPKKNKKAAFDPERELIRIQNLYNSGVINQAQYSAMREDIIRRV